MHLVHKPAIMYQNLEAMDLHRPSAIYTRNRSYSHQVQPEGLNIMPPTHRSLDFEFNLEDHIKKTRKAASYLKQVFHSQQCGGKCASPLCRRILRVLQHTENCENEQCMEPGCATTKKLLRHSMECQSSNSPCSTSFLNTPTLNLSKGSNNNGNNVSRNLNTHLATTPSNQFCLLCTIARTDTVTEMAPTNIASSRHEDAMDIEEDGDAHYDNGFDRQFMPIVSDEIIEFSRIPFQQHGQRMKTMSHDGINEVFRQPISLKTAALSPVGQPTSKKARSKSLNAVSLDVLALQPLQGTMMGSAAAADGF
jgi:hypothetical protein